MATTIVTKSGSGAPTASDLVAGELAVDLTNKRLYTEDSGGTVLEVGSNPYNFTANHDGSAKLATTATGIDVTGSVTADGLTISSTGEVVSTISSTSTSGVRGAKLRLNVASTGGDDPAGTIEFTYGTGYTVAGSIAMTHTNPAMKFLTGTTEAMRIDGNRKLLIGDSASHTSDLLQIETPASGGGHGIQIRRNDSNTDQAVGSITFGNNTATDLASISAKTDGATDNGALLFNTSVSGGANTTRMVINSAGNVLVGTTQNNPTSSGVNVAGQEFSATGGVRSTVASNAAATFNRKTDDGAIALFRKDGSTVGSIGVDNNDNFYIGASTSGHSGFYFGNGSAAPMAAGTRVDNTIDLGTSTYRFKDLYLSGNAHADNFVGTNDTDTFVSMAGSNIMRFYTGGAEAARLDASGNLLVGCTALPSGGAGGAGFETGQSGGRTILQLGTTVTSTEAVARFYNPNGAIGSISLSGSTTSYNTSSDQRLKENIADADDAGSKIDAIQVRKFDWKVDGSHQDYGMVAQELQAVAPEAVSAPEDPEEMMGVDYSKLVPMMLKEIQSLRARIAALES
jgi:hypothetical protein